MAKVDSVLQFLSGEQEADRLMDAEAESAFSVGVEEVDEPTVPVFVQFRGDLAVLEEAGLAVRTVAGDVVTGDLALSSVDSVAALEEVVRLEGSRVLMQDLNVAVPEIRADQVHTGPPGHRGSGVIVGVIDSGVDYQHGAFRRPDGTSRIIAIWDQALVAQTGEAAPAGFGYGVEYRTTAINTALSAADPFSVVRHRDSAAAGFHGTHVCGIAAGDGSPAGAGQPANTFIGVAPEADLIVVANNRGRASSERGLGDSADTLDAIRYVFDLAASLGRPAVINQSQGDNIGPHDGTSLLERGIDNLLGGAGRAMVKSAGNEGSLNCHASGTLTPGATDSPRLNVTAERRIVTVDIWYPGPDRIAFSITPPGGVASAVVNAGSTQTFNLPNGNRVFVDSALNDPGNSDNRIFVVIQPGTEAFVQQGAWTLNLRGATVTAGQWDAWVQRDRLPRPGFLTPFVNPARTISIPGTSREVITAGSYVNVGAGAGSLSSFSSLGPTRDGRPAPVLAAPGQNVTSAAPASAGTYQSMSGTSMAAPMVAGTIALLLQANPSLTQERIRTCLTDSARNDAFTGATPNNAWGAGKLDAQAAFQCAAPVRPSLRAPCLSLRPPCGPSIRVPCVPESLRVPCGPSIRVPCLPESLRTPCGPSIRVPCVPSVQAPCPSIQVPCNFPSQRVPCRDSLGPGCGLFEPGKDPRINPAVRPVGKLEQDAWYPESAGWVPAWWDAEVAAGWGSEGAGPLDDWGGEAGQPQVVGPATGQVEEPGPVGDYTDWWYGNSGY